MEIPARNADAVQHDGDDCEVAEPRVNEREIARHLHAVSGGLVRRPRIRAHLFIVVLEKAIRRAVDVIPALAFFQRVEAHRHNLRIDKEEPAEYEVDRVNGAVAA